MVASFWTWQPGRPQDPRTHLDSLGNAFYLHLKPAEAPIKHAASYRQSAC
jgi:hypothetical protein